MQVNSFQNQASVDFSDGYSYLPFVPINIGVKGAAITPADYSTLLHEFTHHCALKGPFGVLCAQIHGARAALRKLAFIEADVMSKAMARAQNGDALPAVSADEILEAACADTLANFTDLFGTYRYWLEGIAMFAQLDLKISKDYDAASEAVYFFTIFENYDVRFGSSGSGSATMEEVSSLFDEARNSLSKNGFRRFFFTNPIPENGPYFIGYLLVRRIQRMLAQIDPRLADPELYYIFVNLYIFSDATLQELWEPRPREQYQQEVNKFLGNRLCTLINARPEELRPLVDTITDFKTSPVHFERLDFATSLRLGILKPWTDDLLPDRFAAEAKTFLDKTLQHPAFAILGQYADQDMKNEAHAFLLHTVGVLLHTMKYFKISHRAIAILGIRKIEDERRCQVAWRALDGGAWSVEPMPMDDAEALYRMAESGKFDILVEEGSFAERTMGWSHEEFRRRAQQGSLLIVEAFEVYSLVGRQRMRVMFREDFCSIFSRKWREGGDVHTPMEEDDATLLKGVRGWLSPSRYYEDITVPEPLRKVHAQPDGAFLSKQAESWWRLLFPKTEISSSDFENLACQKLRLLCMLPDEDQLIGSLCEAQEVVATPELTAVAARLNTRWIHFTGESLILSRFDNGEKLCLNL